MLRLAFAGAFALMGCSADAANPEFNDAAIAALIEFGEQDPVVLAYAVRQLERSVEDVDLDGGLLDRSSEPALLSQADLVWFPEVPDRDPASCQPVSVVHLSPHGMAGHVQVQMLEDQTPIQPASPEYYERLMYEGADCFAQRDCEFLRTENPLVKDNAIMTLSYTLWKDLRWIDLNLPDPADVPEGETAVNQGEPRWAIVSPTWLAERASSEGEGPNIEQSYTLEVWLPHPDGTLRVMAQWTETTFSGPGYPEDVVAGTTRAGIQGIFDAGDDWLDQN